MLLGDRHAWKYAPVGYVEPKAGDITKLYGLEDVVLHLVA
jgi:hypothetical protein